MRTKTILVAGTLLIAALLIAGCTQNSQINLNDMEQTAVAQTLTAMAPTLPPPTETPDPNPDGGDIHRTG